MGFKKAVKQQGRLRCAMFGPSGAGKTYSALAIATGIVSVTKGKIALIDSERSTAAKYADRFLFDTDDLFYKTIDEYIAKIGDAAAAKYDVLIIDSMSHAWQELLESIDNLAKAKYKGNTWSAWSEGTPKQKALIEAIQNYPGHLIATMRSKTTWESEQTGGGKSRPVRVGLAPEQGKGIEYEFDLLLELSTEHLANVIKDRTGKYQDVVLDKPGKVFGQELIGWLMEGAPVQERSATPPPIPAAAPKTAAATAKEAAPIAPSTTTPAEPYLGTWIVTFKLTPEQKVEADADGWKHEARTSKTSGKSYDWTLVPKDPAAFKAAAKPADTNAIEDGDPEPEETFPEEDHGDAYEGPMSFNKTISEIKILLDNAKSVAEATAVIQSIPEPERTDELLAYYRVTVQAIQAKQKTTKGKTNA